MITSPPPPLTTPGVQNMTFVGREGLVLATWHAHKYRIYAATIMADAEFTGRSKKVLFSAKLCLIIT